MSVRADLETAVAALDRLIAIRESPDCDKYGLLEHSYWLTVRVHYARCFAEGQRKTGLSDALVKQKLPEHSVVLHRWMRDMRNKYMAHDENPYHQFVGSVIIRRSPDGRTLVSPNVAAGSIIAVDAVRARAVRQLIVGVGEIVQERLAKARDDFVKAIAQRPLGDRGASRSRIAHTVDRGCGQTP